MKKYYLKTTMKIDLTKTRKEDCFYVYKQKEFELDFVVGEIKILKDYFLDAPEEIIVLIENG